MPAAEIFNPNEQINPLDVGSRTKQLQARQQRLKDYMRTLPTANEGQLVGGQWIAPSAADHIGKFFGAVEAGANDRELAKLDAQDRAALKANLARLSGTEGRAEIPPNYVMQSPEDQAGVPGIEAVPAPTGADRRAIIADIYNSAAGEKIGGALLTDELISAPIRESAERVRTSESALAREAKKELADAEIARRVEADRLRRLDDERYRRTEETRAREHAQLVAATAARGGGGPRDRYQVQTLADGTVVRVNLDTGQYSPVTAEGAGGAPLNKGVKPVNLTAKQLDTQRGFMDLESSLNNYDAMLAKYDPQGKAASSPTQRAAIEGAYTDLQMKLKNLYELGAPQAGDLKLLSQSIPSPVDLNGTIRGAAFGAEPFKVKNAEIRKLLNNSRTNFEVQMKKATPAAAGGGVDAAKTVVREVKLKDGRTGVEYSDGSRGFK